MLSAVFFEVGYYVEHSLVVKYLARGVPAYFSPITRAVSMKRMLFLGLAALAVSSSATAPSIPQMRMSPAEIVSGDQGDSQIGSSKLAGVHTKVLAGNPASTGFYSILLFVPAHTTIQGHSHRDAIWSCGLQGNSGDLEGTATPSHFPKPRKCPNQAPLMRVWLVPESASTSW